MQSPRQLPEDPRIAPIRRHIEDGKIICDYGTAGEKRGLIHYAVAPEDLNPDALVPEIERFHRGRMQALIVLAPPGFGAEPTDVKRVEHMAMRMNEAIWMAFAIQATQGDPEWNRDLLTERWQVERNMAEMHQCAVQPYDKETSYNIQAMGPWYRNQKHYRYAPGDLFLLAVSMNVILKLQQCAKENVTIDGIRRKAYESTAGIVDFLRLVVPETLEELHPMQQALIRLQQMTAQWRQ